MLSNENALDREIESLVRRLPPEGKRHVLALCVAMAAGAKGLLSEDESVSLDAALDRRGAWRGRNAVDRWLIARRFLTPKSMIGARTEKLRARILVAEG